MSLLLGLSSPDDIAAAAWSTTRWEHDPGHTLVQWPGSCRRWQHVKEFVYLGSGRARLVHMQLLTPLVSMRILQPAGVCGCRWDMAAALMS
jgi:hypothetical protein